MNNQQLKIVQQALNEDLGSGDISARLLPDKKSQAHIIARESAIICGIDYATQAFFLVDDSTQLNWRVRDGAPIENNQVICTLSGQAGSIVSAERVALNFLQTLSATATQTRYLVDKIAHTKTQILDTRKTIPNLREAQKYAVKCGGGVNHRMGLYDAVMLKENHISAMGQVRQAVKMAREKYPDLPLIVEVENLEQLRECLTLNSIDRLLCDNFSIQNLVRAVDLTRGNLPLEASGNINADNIVQVAETGVDFISMGGITKNIQAIDLSLRFA